MTTSDRATFDYRSGHTQGLLVAQLAILAEIDRVGYGTAREALVRVCRALNDRTLRELGETSGIITVDDLDRMEEGRAA